MTADVFTLAVQDASVEVAPEVGGAIASFACAGHDVLRPTPADARAVRDVRRFACYPLVPYSNRIAQAQLRVRDETHVLAHNFGDHPHCIHGVGWQRPWQRLAHDATDLLMALDHAPRGDDASAWPYAFRATQSVGLAPIPGGAMLTLTLSIENRDHRSFPFGLGWHPFFRREPATELGFVADGVWETDATRLPTRHVAVAAATRFDPPRPIGTLPIDNVFTGWRGEAQVRWPDARRCATLEADRSLAFLVVFVPTDPRYLAVEPVTHMTDAFNRAARGERDTGTLELAPGEARSCTMRIVSAPLR